MEDIQKDILKTIIYYDLLDYPLTSFEVWKYLIRSKNKEEGSKGEEKNIDFKDFLVELAGPDLAGKVEEHWGFYFLSGRNFLVSQRLERNKIAEQKFKITRRVVWWLRFVPFVRMVAVTGRLAMKNTERKSDLDLLIVLKHKHIFTGRFLVTGLVHLLRKRRYGGKITDRICLNYFITDKSLEIELQDLFSSSEYYFALPLLGLKKFRRFREENNWIKKYRPNYAKEKIANFKIIPDSFFSKAIRKAGEKIWSSSQIENRMKNWQLNRIQNNPLTHQSGSLIVANDQSLVFLPSPQGPKIIQLFEERLKEFNL